MRSQTPSPRVRTEAPAPTEFSDIPPNDRPRALTVRQVMTSETFTAGPSWSLLEAAQTMRDKHVSGLPVVDEKDQVLGVVSERDILAELDRSVGLGSPRGVLELLLDVAGRASASRMEQCVRRLERAHVSEVMTRRVVTIDPDSSMGEAARLLRAYSVKRLPVVENGRLIGIVTRQNLADALA